MEPQRGALVSGPAGLGTWSGNDHRPRSQHPPGGLAPHRVPMLVSIGFDDNKHAGDEGDGVGVTWVLNLLRCRRNGGPGRYETFDQTPARVSFYLTTEYAGALAVDDPLTVRQAWHRALLEGHEIGNHTARHCDGEAYDGPTWTQEIAAANSFLTSRYDAEVEGRRAVGLGVDHVYGFRAPFILLNDELYPVLKAQGFWYDCSIEDGFQEAHDGTNFHWPYTLDDGGREAGRVAKLWRLPVGKHPGIWEMPAHPVIVPPDEEARAYGIPPGLRASLAVRRGWDEPVEKITGFDYNLWVQFKMTRAEFVATLKYTLDLRLRGNRAPFVFGAHSDYYGPPDDFAPNATASERKAAMAEFVDHVLATPDARLVPTKSILDWVRNPVPLG
jgi:hypothetical protein